MKYISDPYDNARVMRRVIFNLIFRNNFLKISPKEDKTLSEVDLQSKISFVPIKINTIKLIFLRKRKNKLISKYSIMIQALGLLEITLMMECSHILNMFHKRVVLLIQRKFKNLFLKMKVKRKSLSD